MLYFVATPIGNLKEITYRAVEILSSSDYIYAEDTRHSLILLNEYGIKAPLISYQKFNEKSRCAEIIEKLGKGKTISVISDAGMPLISDPGSVLAKELAEKGLEFSVVSGPCAAINALVLSGLDTSAFYMAGFLPQKKSACRALLNKLGKIESTLVFYAAPHDIAETLNALYEAFGGRKVAVAREISKKFETVYRGRLGEDLGIIEKGEMAVVVEGAEQEADYDETQSVKEHLQTLISSGMNKKDAVKVVAAARKLPKNDVYQQSFDIENTTDK